jgi:P-type Cu+ transporter
MHSAQSTSTSTSIERVELDIQGMNCASCVRHVEHALRDIASVRNVVIDLASGRASVDSTDATHPEQLIAAVEETGYTATVVQRAHPQGAAHG